jgi:hypothetical protein
VPLYLTFRCGMDFDSLLEQLRSAHQADLKVLQDEVKSLKTQLERCAILHDSQERRTNANSGAKNEFSLIFRPRPSSMHKLDIFCNVLFGAHHAVLSGRCRKTRIYVSSSQPRHWMIPLMRERIMLMLPLKSLRRPTWVHQKPRFRL